MRARVRCGLVAGLMIVWACARPRPASPPPAEGAPVATAEDAPALDARLEAKLEAWTARRDWRSTVFGARIDNPPNAKRARSGAERGPLRAADVRTIRAYHFQNGFRGVSWEGAPFTADGRLIDGVVPPETTLDADETAAVLALIANAEEARKPQPGARYVVNRAKYRCGFDPHHVLVFFDAQDIPIAKLYVCFSCGEILSVPKSDAFDGGAMTREERGALRALFDAHGLGAWSYDEDDPLVQEVRNYEERVYGSPSAPTSLGVARNARLAVKPSGVSGDAIASRLDASEHERLCLWLTDEVSRRKVRGGVECSNGTTYSFGFFEERPCTAKPLCDAPVARVEACLRKNFLQGASHVCDRGLGAECEGLLGCLPGVENFRP